MDWRLDPLSPARIYIQVLDNGDRWREEVESGRVHQLLIAGPDRVLVT